MSDAQRFWRQLDIVDSDKLNIPITIIGAGAIGSFTCLALAKMGCSNITVYDIDKIEDYNLPNQFYRESDVGKLKVNGLYDLIKDFTGVKINIKNEKYKKQNVEGIVISAVDNMETRKDLWKKVEYNPQVKLFVDGRMGAEVMRIYTVKPHDIDEVKIFEDNLYTDKEAAEEKCTEKAIIYNVTVIGGLIASNIKKYVMDQKYIKEIIFDLKNLYLLASETK